MPDAPLVVAIDGGGSGSRAVLARAGSVVARVEVAPIQLTTMSDRTIRATLDRAIDALAGGLAAGAIEAICVGVAGAGRAQRRLLVERWAAGRLPSARVEVCRDVDLVLAHGSAGVGVAAIAGTGAVVLGRTAQGEERIADGRGPLVGDRGGGFQLGLDAVRLVLRRLDADARPPAAVSAAICRTLEVDAPADAAQVVSNLDAARVARVAAIAAQLCELAEGGDTVAERLVRAAARELARSYRYVERGLPSTEQLPHLLAGGLATAPAYRRAFVAETHPSWRPVREPVMGGVAIAMRLAARP